MGFCYYIDMGIFVYTTRGLVLVIAFFALFFGLARAQEQADPPTNVAASQMGFSESINITWDASATEEVTLYKVYRSTSSTSQGTKLHDAHQGLSFTDDTTSYNTTYYYRVVALLNDLESEVSDQASAKPIVPAPINVQAIDTKESKTIKVTWDRPTYGLILSFDVFRSTSSSSRGSRIKSRVQGTEYKDTRATNGTTYYYRVQSISESRKNSADSSSASARATDESTPESPVVSTRVLKNNSIRVTWTKPSNSSIDEYRVYRSKSSSELGDFRIETTGRSFTEHALDAGTYYYRVRAVGESGNLSLESDPASAVIIGSGISVLLPVSDLSASSTGRSGQIKITWKNPPNKNFSSLRIYRNTFSSLGSMIADKVRGQSYTDSNLTNGITYYYIVRTINNAGDEQPDNTFASAIPNISSKNKDTPPKISKLKVLDLSDGKSIKLSWTNPAPHLYEFITIYRSTSPSELGNPIRSRYRGNEYTNTTGVQTNQKYYYTVVTKGFNGVESEENQYVAGIATLILENDTFDTDSDGLPDTWERAHGYHPHLKDLPDSDDDSDGLGLLEEFENNTDPWNSDSDDDGYSDGTEVLNEYDPNGAGKKVKIPQTKKAKNKPAFAYGKIRLASLSQEQDLALQLRASLEEIFGKGKVPNPRKHWPKLVNSFIYGKYTAAEIAHTLKQGPGLVHPVIPSEVWRDTDGYKRKNS